MAADTLKAQAQSRELKVGHFIVEFATPGIGHMLKNAGCDFVLFDTEHSGFHHETIKSVLRYFEAARLPTIVRVPSKEYHHIARAADMGAEGIMLPMVNDAKEARHVLDCMKYTPDGQRGVALAVAHDLYRSGAVLDKLAAANARITFFAQIETRAGVENADTIAALDGVDCLWVGHFDLSASLGIPGQFEHRDFLEAIGAVVRACRKHGKAAGRLVPDVATGIDYNKKGFDFICYSGDVWAYQAAVKAGVDGIRAACGGGK
jgi:2-keto-3-deoxy-L-rhamnonate aldolase RhmA